MATDSTTFFLAFASLFGILGYLWFRLDRRARSLEAQVAALEARTQTDMDSEFVERS